MNIDNLIFKNVKKIILEGLAEGKNIDMITEDIVEFYNKGATVNVEQNINVSDKKAFEKFSEKIQENFNKYSSIRR